MQWSLWLYPWWNWWWLCYSSDGPSTHTFPHSVVISSFSDVNISKEAPVKPGSNRHLMLFTVMRNSFIVQDTFWNVPRWFLCGAFANADSSRGSNMSCCNDFLPPMLSQYPCYMYSHCVIGVLPDERAWCWWVMLAFSGILRIYSEFILWWAASRSPHFPSIRSISFPYSKCSFSQPSHVMRMNIHLCRPLPLLACYCCAQTIISLLVGWMRNVGQVDPCAPQRRGREMRCRFRVAAGKYPVTLVGAVSNVLHCTTTLLDHMLRQKRKIHFSRILISWAGDVLEIWRMINVAS